MSQRGAPAGAPGGGEGAPPQFDLWYDIGSDIPPRELWEHDPDSVYYFDTAGRLVHEEVMRGAHGRLLDVGSGSGLQLLEYARVGTVRVYGLDMSHLLLRQSHTGLTSAGVDVGLISGAAEHLPFGNGTFERIVCQGSLDHFADPDAFLRESARLLKGEGRLIIALQNFDSASCRISRATYRLRGAAGIARDDPTGAERPYWRIPHNHTFRGNVAVLKRLAGRYLELERMYGVSMFWLLPSWRRLLKRAAPRTADRMLRAADRGARRMPGLADMIISTWRKP
jgi:SAM-dependent methyltransferase